ncbi:MAG: ester cyclase [Ideonella sp.]|nr:ester cyclase [Ideonella sp.]
MFLRRSLTVLVLGTSATAFAQSPAPTAAQRALIDLHYSAYGVGGDAAKIFPQTTTADFQSCGANGSDCQGREPLAGQLGGIKKGLPDMKWEVLEVIAAGDRIIVRGQGSGTPAGPFFGVPYTGRSFKVMSIDIHTLRDGKIAYTHHLEDWAGAIRQLAGQPGH